jgi:hypothetical protein
MEIHYKLHAPADFTNGYGVTDIHRVGLRVNPIAGLDMTPALEPKSTSSADSYLGSGFGHAVICFKAFILWEENALSVSWYLCPVVDLISRSILHDRQYTQLFLFRAYWLIIRKVILK